MEPARSAEGATAVLTAEALPAGSLRTTAVRASMWTLGGYGAIQVIRLASNLVLSRLLFPAAFGQMALVSTFLRGLAMFADVGTGPAIIQSPRGDDRRMLDTAWTIEIARGVVLWLAACAIARPVAAFYGDPLLAWLIPVCGLTAVIAGFESTKRFTVRRHLQLGHLTVIDLVTQVVSAAVIVALTLLDRALLGPHHPSAVWAIVGGAIAASVAHAVMTATVLPGPRNRLLFDRDMARALFRVGRWIFVSTVLTFFAGQSDRLVFGKLIPLDMLGVYGIATTLAAFATEAILKIGDSVVFPAYSRTAARGALADLFDRVRLPLLVGGGTLVTGLLACGPYLVRVLYDARYVQAGWIVQCLAAMAWFTIVECTNTQALLALGRVKWLAAGNATKVIGMIVLIPLGYRVGGFVGTVVALVVSEFLKYVISAVAIGLVRLSGWVRDALLTAAVAGSACAAVVAGRVASGLARGTVGNVAGLLAAGLVTVLLWGAIAVCVWRGELARWWHARRPAA